MLSTLAEAVDSVEIGPFSEELVEGFALLSKLEAKLTAAVGDFDAAQKWCLDGDTSMTAWLRRHADLTSADASWFAKAGRQLRSLPVTAAAWLAGRLGLGQTKAVLANVSNDTLGLFAESEAELIPTLERFGVKDVAALMQRWAARAEALIDKKRPRAHRRDAYLAETLNGRFDLRAGLDGVGGQILAKALSLAMTPDSAAEEARTTPERRADALVDIARFFLDHQHHRPGGRHRPHLNVIAELDDGEGLARFADGATVDRAFLETLFCDSGIHRVLRLGRSAIVDYGTTTRTVGASLFNALVLRDRHCRFVGCDRGPEWCEAHHVVAVEDNGPTRLDNLVLACSRHHHLWHDQHWKLALHADGHLSMIDANGVFWVSQPAEWGRPPPMEGGP